jgi:hypothetical protein
VSEDLRRSSHFSSKNYIRPHGVGLRGLDVPRGSEQFEGRFGRMFRTLMAAEHNQAELAALATAMKRGREARASPFHHTLQPFSPRTISEVSVHLNAF